MQQDSRDLPPTQVFELHDAVIFICSPEPEPESEPDSAEPDPPPRTYDEDSGRTLMEMAPLVRRVLSRLGVPHADVADLTQNVLLDLLNWWTTRGPVLTAAARREARAYVAVVARRAAYRHYRRRLQRGELAPSGDTLFFALDERDTPSAPSAPAQPSPEEAALAAEAGAELASEVNLDALGAATAPALWRAFYAWAVLGAPVELIADSERVPVSTIYNRIRLAREDLRASVRRKRAAKRP